jgi:hypothetical protein
MPTSKTFDIANKKVFTYKKLYTSPGYPDDGQTFISQTYSDTKNRLYSNLNNYKSGLMSSAEVFHSSLFTGSTYYTNLVDSYYIVGTNKGTVTHIVATVTGETGGLESVGYNITNSGDGTVPIWSANLGGMYGGKTFYATNRDHSGQYNYSNGTVTKEGLVVSANVIQKVINIINGNPYSSVTGISQTAPAYSPGAPDGNGWIVGGCEEQAILSFAQNKIVTICNSDETLLFSNEPNNFTKTSDVNVFTENGITTVVITMDKISIKVNTLSNSSGISLSLNRAGVLQKSQTINGSSISTIVNME